jgi:hypothetical protein
MSSRAVSEPARVTGKVAPNVGEVVLNRLRERFEFRNGSAVLLHRVFDLQNLGSDYCPRKTAPTQHT